MSMRSVIYAFFLEFALLIFMYMGSMTYAILLEFALLAFSDPGLTCLFLFIERLLEREKH